MVLLGKVKKFRGNKGEVVIEPSPGFQGVADGGLRTLQLRSAKYTQQRTVEYAREIGGQAVVKFAGIDTIGDAQRIIGYELYGDAPRRPRRREMDLHDLIGFQVRDLGGAVWGSIADFLDNPRNPLLEVRPGNGGESILVPWSEAIVKRIDRRQRVVWIDPPAGLKELNS